MSNESVAICKECMLERIVRSFEVSRFPRDRPLTGLQRWWLRRSKHLDGSRGICGIVFAHLLIWYTVLRAAPAGVKVLDYAKLMLYDRKELRGYLEDNLPPALKENPGVVGL